MKIINSFLLLLFFALNVKAEENTYTGSTPADSVIRLFLRIPLKDSIDFIRWQLILDDKHYTLNCNYGISKPNTNGFINGGKKIMLAGAVSKEKNYYRLQNQDKSLKIAEINRNLLQLLDGKGTFVVREFLSLSPNFVYPFTYATCHGANDRDVIFRPSLR